MEIVNTVDIGYKIISVMRTFSTTPDDVLITGFFLLTIGS